MADNIKYSEAFKRQVVDELARGRHQSIESARRAYGIKGSMTVTHWVRRYGSTDLLPKRIRIETRPDPRLCPDRTAPLRVAEDIRSRKSV